MSEPADSSSPSPSPSDNQHDVFGPPSEAIEVHCLHCDHVYTSDLIVPIEAADGSVHHACPVPNCDGMGFGFDIHPTDPTWQSEELGYFQYEDDEDDCSDEDEDQDDASDDDDGRPFLLKHFKEADDSADEAFEGELIADEVRDGEGQFDPPREWTPEADREDGDVGEFDLFAPEGASRFGEGEDEDEDDGVFDDPDSQYVRPAPKRFTREEFEQAKADGVYEKLAESIREWWSSCERRRKDGGPDSFSDDDIPF